MDRRIYKYEMELYELFRCMGKNKHFSPLEMVKLNGGFVISYSGSPDGLDKLVKRDLIKRHREKKKNASLITGYEFTDKAIVLIKSLESDPVKITKYLLNK